MDVLTRLLDHAQLHGFLGSCSFGNPNSLYADVAILFLKPKQSEMKNVSELLQLLEQCLAHNIFPILCSRIDLQPLQAISGWALGQFHCAYMGGNASF
jgi:hypothetical protein